MDWPDKIGCGRSLAQMQNSIEKRVAVSQESSCSVWNDCNEEVNISRIVNSILADYRWANWRSVISFSYLASLYPYRYINQCVSLFFKLIKTQSDIYKWIQITVKTCMYSVVFRVKCGKLDGVTAEQGHAGRYTKTPIDVPKNVCS